MVRSIVACFEESFFAAVPLCMCKFYLARLRQLSDKPPLGKELLTWLPDDSLCDMFVCISVISHFDFEDTSLVLIVQVPGHCLSFSFIGNNFCKLPARLLAVHRG